MSDDWYKNNEYPPVGTVCEYVYVLSSTGGIKLSEWKPVKILAYDDIFVWLSENHKTEAYHKLRFRPANYARDKVVESVIESLGLIGTNDVKTLIGLLYQRGCLKVDLEEYERIPPQHIMPGVL